jgi:hypothetical protein
MEGRSILARACTLGLTGCAAARERRVEDRRKIARQTRRAMRGAKKRGARSKSRSRVRSRAPDANGDVENVVIEVKLTDEEWAVFDGSSVHVGANEVVSGIDRERSDRADGQDWRSVDRQLRSLAQRRAALDVEEARLLLLARRLAVHIPLGYGTFVEYVERVLGYRPRTAQERLRVAERLEELPATRAALAAGEVSYSAVRELTRVATPDTEDAWLAGVRGRTMREIEHALAGRAEGDHPDDPADPDLEPRRLPLELTPEAYALWLEARRRLEDELGERLDDSAVITAMARRVLEPAGAAAAAAAPATSRPPYQIAITLCPRCDRATQAAAGDVVDVRPESVEQACCDALHLGRVDGEHVPAPTLTIPVRTRAAVLARDHHRCTVPGCRSTRGLELHHIQWRSRGGDHRPRNLTCLCAHHHAAVHHGHLRITGEAPHALRFERAGDTPCATDVVAEVRAALRGLGFRPADVTRAVEQASVHVGADAPLEAWLRAALRACPRPASAE